MIAAIFGYIFVVFTVVLMFIFAFYQILMAKNQKLFTQMEIDRQVEFNMDPIRTIYSVQNEENLSNFQHQTKEMMAYEEFQRMKHGNLPGFHITIV